MALPSLRRGSAPASPRVTPETVRQISLASFDEAGELARLTETRDRLLRRDVEIADELREIAKQARAGRSGPLVPTSRLSKAAAALLGRPMDGEADPNTSLAQRSSALYRERGAVREALAELEPQYFQARVRAGIAVCEQLREDHDARLRAVAEALANLDQKYEEYCSLARDLDAADIPRAGLPWQFADFLGGSYRERDPERSRKDDAISRWLKAAAKVVRGVPRP